jgi:hypothetical protein
MKSRSIIRVFDRTDPSVYENCQCTNVNQRLQNIRDNILAIKGLNTTQVYPRWHKFADVALEHIDVEVFRSHKITGLSTCLK